MTNQGETTIWLRRLAEGDQRAAQEIWERYFCRLVGVARRQLQVRTVTGDEEDVALSAFYSFYKGAEEGRFPRLQSRDDLWQVLLMLTARKAGKLLRKERALKRGGGKQHLGSAEDAPHILDEVIGKEPTPEFALLLAEDLERLLAFLPTEELRRISLLKLEAYTNQEIAAQLGLSERSIQRRINLTRSIWLAVPDDDVSG